jgi:predicted nuclease of predicted toxin-antitoxin system
VRIKLDENMPAALVNGLATLGHDVDTVPDEGLASRPDPDIWAAAQRTRRFLITQDLDFSDLRRFAPGTHHGLLLVRLAQPGRRALAERIHAIFESEEVESWRRCFVVATDRKIRVKRPSRRPLPKH